VHFRFRYRDSIAILDTWDGIVIVAPISRRLSHNTTHEQRITFVRGFVDNFKCHTSMGRFMHLCAAVTVVIGPIQCRRFNCFCTVWFLRMYVIDRQRGARTCHSFIERLLCVVCYAVLRWLPVTRKTSRMMWFGSRAVSDDDVHMTVTVLGLKVRSNADWNVDCAQHFVWNLLRCASSAWPNNSSIVKGKLFVHMFTVLMNGFGCGRFGFGRFGLWPFWIFSVAVLVWLLAVLVCGRFGRNSFLIHRKDVCAGSYKMFIRHSGRTRI